MLPQQRWRGRRHRVAVGDRSHVPRPHWMGRAAFSRLGRHQRVIILSSICPPLRALDEPDRALDCIVGCIPHPVCCILHAAGTTRRSAPPATRTTTRSTRRRRTTSCSRDGPRTQPSTQPAPRPVHVRAALVGLSDTSYVYDWPGSDRKTVVGPAALPPNNTQDLHAALPWVCVLPPGKLQMLRPDGQHDILGLPCAGHPGQAPPRQRRISADIYPAADRELAAVVVLGAGAAPRRFRRSLWRR